MAWRAKEPATLRDDERSIEMRADKILNRIRGSMTLDKQSGRAIFWFPRVLSFDGGMRQKARAGLQSVFCSLLGSQACGYHAVTFSKQSLKDSKLRFVPLHLQDC